MKKGVRACVVVCDIVELLMGCVDQYENGELITLSQDRLSTQGAVTTL